MLIDVVFCSLTAGFSFFNAWATRDLGWLCSGLGWSADAATLAAVIACARGSVVHYEWSEP